MITIEFYKGDIQYHITEEVVKGMVVNKAKTRINIPYTLMPSMCFYVDTDRIKYDNGGPKCFIEAGDDEEFILLETEQDKYTNMWHDYKAHTIDAKDLKKLMADRSEMSIKYGAKLDKEPVTFNSKGERI